MARAGGGAAGAALRWKAARLVLAAATLRGRARAAQPNLLGGQVSSPDEWVEGPEVKLWLASARNNEVIRFASMHGHKKVVALLLYDPRVDPSADNNSAVLWAATHGHEHVVELLLTDPCVDPSTHNNRAMQLAQEAAPTNHPRDVQYNDTLAKSADRL